MKNTLRLNNNAFSEIVQKKQESILPSCIIPELDLYL